MIKYLAILLLLCSNLVAAQNADISSLDPSQVYNTVNLVNNTTTPNGITGTWQNLGLVNQGLPCWGPGGPIYCGPQPFFNQGSFNFSYGLTDVYQIANIANALPNSGTGLRVNGFNFSFLAKNGNGWDDGRVDKLSAYVNFYDKSNNLATNYYYDLNYKFNWTQFNFSKNFDTPYISSELSNVRYGFIGADNNFWAGPYGPEVTNVSFSLKYSVDPCHTNPLSSTSCPGFNDAFKQLMVESPAQTTTSPTTTTENLVEPISSNSAQTVAQTTNQQLTIQPVVQQPVQAVQTTPVAQSTTQSSAQQTTQSNAGPSLGSVLTMIQSNQARENSIAQTAVSQANQVAQQAAKEAEQTAVATAMASSSQSMENSKDSVRSENKDTKTTNTNSGLPLVAAASSSVSNINPGQNQSITLLPTTATSQQLMPGQQSSSSVANAIANITIQPVIAPSSNNVQQNNIVPTQTINTTTVSRTDLYSLLPPVPVVQEVITPQQTSLPVNNSISAFTTEAPSNSSSFFTNRTDPLQDYVEKNSIMVVMAQPEVRPTTVRTNVQDSTLAGNVRVERLQVVPNGYNMYLSLILRDAAFYESKEIYKNNALRDNARTMYFIEKGNTDTFNKMIQMQYK